MQAPPRPYPLFLQRQAELPLSQITPGQSGKPPNGSAIRRQTWSDALIVASGKRCGCSNGIIAAACAWLAAGARCALTIGS